MYFFLKSACLYQGIFYQHLVLLIKGPSFIWCMKNMSIYEIKILIYWLLCFEQVSNKHIHLLNKGRSGGRCISFPPFIIHRCIISGGKLINRSLILGGKLIKPPVTFILDSTKGYYVKGQMHHKNNIFRCVQSHLMLSRLIGSFSSKS